MRNKALTTSVIIALAATLFCFLLPPMSGGSASEEEALPAIVAFAALFAALFMVWALKRQDRKARLVSGLLGIGAAVLFFGAGLLYMNRADSLDRSASILRRGFSGSPSSSDVSGSGRYENSLSLYANSKAESARGVSSAALSFGGVMILCGAIFVLLSRKEEEPGHPTNPALHV